MLFQDKGYFEQFPIPHLVYHKVVSPGSSTSSSFLVLNLLGCNRTLKRKKVTPEANASKGVTFKKEV